MADDPRIEVDFALEMLDRAGSARLPWTVQRLPNVQHITNGAACLIAECYDAAGIVPELIVRAVNALPAVAAELVTADAMDPLRALLADEERAVEFATQARYEVAQIQLARNYPHSTSLKSWEDFPEWAKVNWRAETRKLCGPVLAALREVAGL